MKVAILLSTYNGEKYLKDQLKSLINQTYTDWEVYIRDDGSKDKTLNIIYDFKDLYPNQIFIIQDNLGNLKSAKSFMTLLMYVQSDFYMFCDQDDYWVPNKIELSVNKILKLQKIHGNVPALVFTDLKVVDENLNLIHSSLWSYSKINPEHIFNFYKLATNSTVTGCTIIINDLLKKSSIPIPSHMLMHDWWLSLLACRIGVIDFILTPTLLYRQHAINVLGAEPQNQKSIQFKLKNLLKVLEKNINFILMIKDKRLRTNLIVLYYYKFRKYIID